MKKIIRHVGKLSGRLEDEIMYFIGIDIGTTSISGIVLDLEKRKIESISKINNNSWLSSKNDWERIQDVTSIVKDIRALLDRFLSQFNDIKGIGITGQMHGILYLDKNGNILSPLYTWQDGRSRLVLDDDLTYVDDLINKTGHEIFPGYGLATHYYNQENNLIPKSTKYISTIADYIAMVLCQNDRPATDYSDAASLGFFNLDKLKFDYSLLDRINIDSSILPEVVLPGTTIGKFKNIYPVVCATGDNQASILGSTKNIEESININIGTGGQVNIFSHKNVKIDGIETRPYFDIGYIFLGASLCGGRAYALLETFFENTSSFLTGKEISGIYDRMEEAGTIEYYSTDRIKVDTRFDGTRTDPSLRGSIKNISFNNLTPEGLIVGFQEGIVEELYSYFEIIENSLKIKPKQLVGSGNGIRKNKLIRLLLEKIFGMPVELTEYTEEAAVGAALTAATGLDYIDSFLHAGEMITYQKH